MELSLPFLFRRESRQEFLRVLRTDQSNSGSFKSFSSFDPNNFKDAAETKTTFISSLVLFSFGQSRIFTKEIRELQKKSSTFLLEQKHPDGTYNYFVGRDTYANDLDDTALAYLALHSYDKKLFTLADAHKFVLALIPCEVKEGGPYTTWLNPNYPKEVDIAVNINIARALQIHGIILPSLSKLISETIKKNNYKSIYYTSPLFTCYFLSFIKSLTSKQKEKIIKYIFSLREEKLWKNFMFSALAINALINLDASNKEISRSVETLNRKLKTREIGHEAICLDPAEDGRQKYCGSKGLTAAMILEIGKFRHQYILSEFNKTVAELNLNIEGLTDCLISDFTELPFAFHQSLCQGSPLADEDLMETTIAYLMGVLAYDIFDNIYDEAKNTKRLPLGLILLDEMTERLEKLGFDRKIIDYFISETNIGMIEETSKIKSDDLYPGRKSIGYALPCFLIISKIGINDESADWQNLYQFFLHFLTARALHDDMNDLEEDKKRNHPNCVHDLFREYPSKNKKLLVDRHINFHIQRAREYINKINFLEPDTYLHYLLNKISL